MTSYTYPNVRQSATCVVCGGVKDQHLLLCWPCHRREKRDNDGGYSPETERALHHAEYDLMQVFDSEYLRSSLTPLDLVGMPWPTTAMDNEVLEELSESERKALVLAKTERERA